METFLAKSSPHSTSVSENEGNALKQIAVAPISDKIVPSSSSCIQISRNIVLDAEIKWALKCITSHYSYNSCIDISSLLKEMFPDSEIAKYYTRGPTKFAYLICFETASFFYFTVV
ncbi:hypothetical protein AVEN_26924-1 [Araneus ventricosus]|uniref:Uncharacterized protein n=1 Tax=Araneus ventricosus TaxID=182803 RepID=A0A4Y2N415_ARAVE|nr:hypothetical protein AVEN_26924-1 [Araneus ventricosus]